MVCRYKTVNTQRVKYIKKVAYALRSFHDMEMSHNDLHHNNILVDPEVNICTYIIYIYIYTYVYIYKYRE